MKDLTDMTIGDLSELLSRLHADVEEVEEERLFVLGQTGVHISAATVAKYDAEVNGLRTRIEAVEQVIRSRKAEEA